MAGLYPQTDPVQAHLQRTDLRPRARVVAFTVSGMADFISRQADGCTADIVVEAIEQSYFGTRTPAWSQHCPGAA